MFWGPVIRLRGVQSPPQQECKHCLSPLKSCLLKRADLFIKAFKIPSTISFRNVNAILERLQSKSFTNAENVTCFGYVVIENTVA